MQTFTIGRNASNNIVLTDEMVSRHHAELVILDNGQILIRDLGSSNGTFVNGNKIKECFLKQGDIVKCATTFFKWSQYVTGYSSVSQPVQNLVYEQGQLHEKQGISTEADVVESNINLNVTLKYLFTRIFSIGDLFKKESNMSSSILFFLITPLALILITCLILYAKYSTNFAQIVIFPLILSIFIFGIPQFFTLSLLSINRESSFTKNLFASSIFSFTQFLNLAVIGIVALFVYLMAGGGIKDIEDLNLPHPLILTIIYFLLISALMSISLTLLIFLYKYFRIIGVSKGISIHLTILTYAINSILQVLFTYAIIAMTFRESNPFEFLLDK